MQPLPVQQGLFGELRAAAGEHWSRYVRHPFVLALGAGTLPEAAFRRFLTQDYLFLIQFARAYALAAFKSDDLIGLRSAAAAVKAIVEVEMPLHIAYCREWGLSEGDMAAEPEALETIAYTRFVLERGLSGDLLELEVALAPCVVGYAEAVERLLEEPSTRREGHPYSAWIDTYAGDSYRGVAGDAIAALDRTGRMRGGATRFAQLSQTFTTATRLEAAFWDMALAAPNAGR
jgi:thiaminase (transcriptional activator TenA)